jgi:protein arginine kinase
MNDLASLIRKRPKRLNIPRIPAEDSPMGCRVRIARNVQEHVFPDRATPLQSTEVLNILMDALASTQQKILLVAIKDFSEQERLNLFEARMISKELANRETGGVAISTDKKMVVMVNEEDHLRIQAFAPGMDIESAWQRANEMDVLLDEKLTYAWTPRFGYLTACPTNLGTGMRASIMLHLMGLRMTGDLDAVLRSLERLRLLVRGLYGEGSESSGHIYQISNMETLGMDEATILARLRRICEEVVRQECQARARMIQDSPRVVQDFFMRSLCLLQNVLMMPSGEAIELLSALRFGVSVGMVTGLTITDIDELMLKVQPGHLMLECREILTPEQRDEFRAIFLNLRLVKAKLKQSSFQHKLGILR